MIFLDYSIMCGDIMTPNVTSTDVNDINSITLQGGAFDDLYATHDVTGEYIYTSTIPTEWDFNTIMHAEFNNILSAGNVVFMLETVSGALLMRRAKDEFSWIILDNYEINTPEDFNITFQDKTARIGIEYEYSFTPILNGVLGNYNITSVVPNTNKLIIADRNEVWSTSLTDGFLDTNRTFPSNSIQTLYDKYPTVIRNTKSNFDTITVTGTWIPSEDGGDCRIIDINDTNNFPYITSYSKKFIDFITNGNAKIIKASDSRIWLVYINDGISDSADQIFMNRKISFTATEIGDPDNNLDLYNTGFLPENVIEWI